MADNTALTTSHAPQRRPDARLARRALRLDKNSAAISVMLLVQYGLGMGVNLYAKIPAADHGIRLAAAGGSVAAGPPR